MTNSSSAQPGWPRPAHPELAALYDQALIDGGTIRYASDTRLVVWKPREPLGCGGLILYLFIAVISLGVALLLGLLALGDKTGDLTTYEVTPSGRIRRRVRRGVH